MKYTKISRFLRQRGLTLSDFARHLNVANQQIGNKKKTDSFRADELISLADLTDTTLCFVASDGTILMSFDTDDIKQ